MLDWLFSEAGVGWIVAIGALLGWAYSIIRRDRPTRIVLQELETIQLLDIHPSQRNKITIQYSDGNSQHPVRNLVQKKIVIYNSGTTDITDSVTFTIGIKGSDLSEGDGIQGFIKSITSNNDFSMKPIRDENHRLNNLEMSLSHINSSHKHKNYIEVFFLSEEFFEFSDKGISGKGWSIEVAKKNRLKKLGVIADMIYSLIGILVGIVAFLAILILLFIPAFYILQGQLGLSSDHPSFGFVAALGFFITVYIMGWINQKIRLRAIRFIADKISMSILNYPPLAAIEDIVL